MLGGLAYLAAGLVALAAAIFMGRRGDRLIAKSFEENANYWMSAWSPNRSVSLPKGYIPPEALPSIRGALIARFLITVGVLVAATALVGGPVAVVLFFAAFALLDPKRTLAAVRRIRKTAGPAPLEAPLPLDERLVVEERQARKVLMMRVVMSGSLLLVAVTLIAAGVADLL